MRDRRIIRVDTNTIHEASGQPEGGLDRVGDLAEDPGKSLNVRPIRGEDFAQWRVLYRGYADFYKAKQSDEMAAQVWSWLQDPEHEVQGLVVEEGEGKLVGLAHYRPFARPLSASVGCYLDDLF